TAPVDLPVFFDAAGTHLVGADEFRQRSPDVAEVASSTARTEAALQNQAVSHARVRGEVDALPGIVLVAEVTLERPVVTRRAHRIVAIALQEREQLPRRGQRCADGGRSGNREAVEVRWPKRLVVGNVEV